MPSISKVRFTNVVYDNGNKRYIDSTFRFDGHNGILLLENGAGKTVFVQTLIQAVLPHKMVANRKIQETLQLSNNIAHIAVEWVLAEQPKRRYGLTAVSLFMNSNNELASQRFAMEYAGDAFSLAKVPFTQQEAGRTRPASKEEMAAWCRGQAEKNMQARFFSEHDSLQNYHKYLEEHFKLIASEWSKIASINSDEGGVEAYFANCRSTGELLSRLLLPTVEEGLGESAGTGSGNGFVEMFQGQREHFKEQVKLQKRINEMRAILQELDVYNGVQRQQYEAEQQLGQVAGRLKAGFCLLKETLTKQETVNAALEAEKAALLEQMAAVQRDLEACSVEEGRLLWQEREAGWQQVFERQQQAEEKLRSSRTALDNLQLARLLQEEKKVGEQLAEYQRALADMEKDATTRELEQERQRLLGCLHSWFAGEEQRLADNKAACQSEAGEQQAASSRLRDSIEKKAQELAVLLAEKNRLEGTIKSLLQQQEHIEQQLFPDGMHQDAASLQRKWQQENRELAKNIEEYQENIQVYNQQAKETEARLAEWRQDLARAAEESAAVNVQLQAMDTRAQAVLDRLALVPECAHVAANTKDLYQRYDFLKNQLADKLVMLERQWQEQQQASRLAHRFWDMYQGREEFTADPALEDRLQELSGDFAYLASGSQLYRELEQQDREKAAAVLEKYPFLAAVAVTSAGETDRLAGKLRSWSEHLQQAVFVLNEQEYRGILEGTMPEGPVCVTPGYWKHIGRQSYAAWLADLQQQAAEADKQEQLLNGQLHELKAVLHELNSFVQLNQQSLYQELCSSRHRLEQLLADLQWQIANGSSLLEQCRENIQKYRENINHARLQCQELANRLSRMEEYLALQKQHREAIALKDQKNTRLALLGEQKKELDQQMQLLQEQLEILRRWLDKCDMELANLQGRQYYKEAMAAAPLADSRDYAVLAESIYSLQIKLDGHSENRRELAVKLQAAARELDRLQEELVRLRENTDSILQEKPDYPFDGAEREKMLQKEIRALRQETACLAKEAGKLRSGADRQKGAYEHAKAQYDSRYQAYPVFGEPLPEMRIRLENQRQAAEQKLKHNQQAIKKGLAESKALDQLRQEMELKNESLRFAAENVVMAVADTAWQDYDSSRLRDLLEPQLGEAWQLWQIAENRRRASEKAKDNFVMFCEGTIRNERVRRQVVEGIRKKQGYLAFAAWKNDMADNIGKIISLSESERQEHFRHIEHMVDRMASYIREICHGLVELMGKTRVKAGEAYKNIFSIHIADWEEHQGRTSIRNCLNSLTEKLESQEFFLDNGQEDAEKINKYLSGQLGTRRILLCVLGNNNNAIRIRCHKAISAGRLSERTYTWEESNRWSGGEMWSKNMALFLGCLNYLSEKRCPVMRTKFNNRVVVADNPFGKASSEHVLDPVFYIARQLGFQLIALTAHEDGSFIRKYFPVVYSCRFASLSQGRGQVLRPVMELKSAYLEEKSPGSLERLMENDYQQGVLDF